MTLTLTRTPVTPKLQLGASVVTIKQGVSSADCLPLPVGYRLPEYGRLANDVFVALSALESANSLFISGPPGTGKDALVHAYCAWTKTPSLIFSIRPNVDIESWFFSRGLGNEGTFWEEGVLLKALRDGYRTPEGKVVPYLVLLSDFDRASKSQAEALRLILDSISGRVQGPDGRAHPVLKGTKIVATANSAGGGDITGRCISSNPIDLSILDRFEVKVKFSPMDWRDEKEVIKTLYPRLGEGSLSTIGTVTTAIRGAVKNAALPFEFSHRTVVGWCKLAVIFMEQGLEEAQALKMATRTWLDAAPDEHTETALRAAADPHFAGGLIEGDDSHISGSLV